jgi:hypothetical protein
VEKAAGFAAANAGPDTYFLSMAKDGALNAEVTSLAAVRGSKVAMTYYGYFPDSTYSAGFRPGYKIPAGKKLIIYFDVNREILSSVDPSNHSWVERSDAGQEFLIIKN